MTVTVGLAAPELMKSTVLFTESVDVTTQFAFDAFVVQLKVTRPRQGSFLEESDENVAYAGLSSLSSGRVCGDCLSPTGSAIFLSSG